MTTIGNGQVAYIPSAAFGYNAFGFNILNGGEMVVNSGGMADYTTISVGGVEVVARQGMDFNALINGTQYVQGDGAHAYSATVDGGGLQEILRATRSSTAALRPSIRAEPP